jgi:fido (protein-threonine AMPylation protein)
MPSQVVQLPAPTLAAILDHTELQRSHAFGIRDLSAKAMTAADGSRALRVHLQPLVHCPHLRDHFVDDVYALLLTSEPPTASPLPAAPPPSLSDGLALHILHETEAALQDLTDLTGHDRLAVSRSLDQARAASPTARPPRSRRPASFYESGLLAEAHRVQDAIAPAMARLGRKLTSYQAGLHASGMQAGVLRLGLQSELGLRLRLDAAGGGMLVPRLFGATRRCGLAGLLRTTHNQLGAFQQAAEAIHEASIADATWLSPARLSSLHETLLSELPGMERAGRLRTGEMRIRSPFDGHVSVLDLPGPEVEEAFAAFAAGFDAALWRNLHPVIRAAAAHLEFARIHPFSDGNGRMARLLMQGLLLEGGVPPLPLEAILAWNRTAYLAAVSRAVQQHDLLGFTRFVLKAVDQAIMAGRCMIRVLRPHCERVRDSFFAVGASGRLALIASEFAGSMVLGPDPQLVSRTVHAVEMAWLLNDSPLFDEVQAGRLGITLGGYYGDSAFSSPVARALTAAPLTLM